MNVRLIAVVGAALLAGCVSVTPEQNIKRVNDEVAGFTEGRLVLIRTDEQKAQQAQITRTLLAAPLGQTQAVHLALANSPALQALLAQGWANSAEAAQMGRVRGPTFSFERLASASELDIGRALSFGLLDILLMPVRQSTAKRLVEQSQLRLAGEVVRQVTLVRQAWVKAVAAQQKLQYAQKVYDIAEASAQLAQRMQAAGNFTARERALQQRFHAEATTSLAAATYQAQARREQLVRLLGLDISQMAELKLPERLPELPAQALSSDEVGALAGKTRLDIRLAQSALAAAGKAQGLSWAHSFTDVELSLQHNSQFDRIDGENKKFHGFGIDIGLPIFDWGGMQRDAMNARTLAAANQLQSTLRAAGSSLQENYLGYRIAYDLVRHHREEVVPIHEVIEQENRLLYNGMLIGVFQFLAEARDQVQVVIAAIEAEQQFWLADAALQAAIIGHPLLPTEIDERRGE